MIKDPETKTAPLLYLNRQMTICLSKCAGKAQGGLRGPKAEGG